LLEAAHKAKNWDTKIDIGGNYYCKLSANNDAHRQYRYSEGNPTGRKVQRGYKGRTGAVATRKEGRFIVKSKFGSKKRFFKIFMKGDILSQVKLQIGEKFGVPMASITKILVENREMNTTKDFVNLPDNSLIEYCLKGDPPIPVPAPTTAPATTKAAISTPALVPVPTPAPFPATVPTKAPLDSPELGIDFSILSDTDLVCFIKATEDILAQANEEKKKRNING